MRQRTKQENKEITGTHKRMYEKLSGLVKKQSAKLEAMAKQVRYILVGPRAER
jgi:hypothetical protein